MANSVFTLREQNTHIVILNTTGAALASGEFALIGAFCGPADEAIASGEYGSIQVEEGSQLQFDASDADVAKAGENTFSVIGDPVYFDPATKKFSDTIHSTYYKVGSVIDTKDSAGIVVFSKARFASLVGREQFARTVTLESSAADTPVDILDDDEVAGRQVFITGLLVKVNGSTAWTDTTATLVAIKDKADTPVTAVSIAKAALTANALVVLNTANVTLGDGVALGTGMTAGKGIDIAADAAFAAGSDLVVTVVGYLA